MYAAIETTNCFNNCLRGWKALETASSLLAFGTRLKLGVNRRGRLHSVLIHAKVSKFTALLHGLRIKRTFVVKEEWMIQPQVIEKRRLVSPAGTPQALAWDRRNKRLWLGSRDLRRIYAIDPENGTS